MTFNGAESGLLEIACARIAALSLPAFIKDSQLRYVAVNEAYARFFGYPVSAFPGRVTGDFQEGIDGDVREDRERRALVFGTEESTLVGAPGGGRSHVLDIERFITDDDHFFLFGIMEKGQDDFSPRHSNAEMAQDVSEREVSISDAGFHDDRHLIYQAFDLSEIGVAAFTADGTLTYSNAIQAELLPVAGEPVRPGDHIRSILERVYDYHFAEGAGDERVRDEWIDERLSIFERDYFERVERTQDGRYIRVVSRRQGDAGLLIVSSDVTQFKLQEDRLREQMRSAEIYRSALEELPVAAFMRDREGRLVYANAAYETMLGDDRDRFLGMDEKAMFPEGWERFRNENMSVIATGRPIEKSEDVIFHGRDVLPVITRVSRILAPGGEPLVLGSVTDVSVLKARENQLVEAQGHAEMLRAETEIILDSLPIGVMLLNEAFVIDYVNAAFANVWGHDTSDLLGATFRDFVRFNFDAGSYEGLGDDFEAVYQSRCESFLGGEEEPLEVHSPHGHRLIIRNRQLSNGKYLLTYYDITAVRAREQEAQEAEEALERLGVLMRDATSVMSQGLLILKDGIIQMSNDALPGMMHMPASMLASGCSWRDVFAVLAGRGDFGEPENARQCLAEWEECIAQRKPISASFLADGKTWLQMEVLISGQEHWLGVFTDVTEMKLREEELTRLLQRAEAADRAKSEFLANMSHEIRTPMNGVLGMAELLAKSNLDTRQKTFTDIIMKSGNALLTIINDILDYSKIDAGQMRLRSMPFDPCEAIEDVASLMSTVAAEKDIDLVVRVGMQKRPVVLGDAGRFRQIVTNLVGNALKFTEKGHVLIDCGIEAVGDGRSVLTLRIEDTGIGIPDDKLKVIFEKFSQVDSSNTRRHEGTGLGLSITSGLVDLFGGALSVTSTPGVGSVFTVRLPFVVASERNRTEALPANLVGAHVLVIDDNATNRAILVEELAGWGFDAYACASGEEAFAIMDMADDADLGIDAVIIDFPMAGEDAVDIVRRMHARGEKCRSAPVIFLTPMDAAGNEVLFASLNVQAHLMKPPRAELLRSTVIEVVRSARVARGMGAEEMQDEDELPPPRLFPALHVAPRRAASHRLEILVAEDNEVNQIVFTQILQATGRSFRIVGNGQEAVEAWRTGSPALILMDVSMPVMNGHQATRLIREIEADERFAERTPIIGVTAHALERDRDLCLESGMDDYLSKPISPELLGAKIDLWLGARRSEAKERGWDWSERL